MDYLNVKEIAEKWGVNVSLVRKYCAEGRIPNAVLRNGVWCIPEGTVRPTRTQKAYAYEEAILFHVFLFLIEICHDQISERHLL